jgi:hypothetical protein
MPIPLPKKGENIDDFINRCMESEIMQTEYTDIKQRYAVCSITYESEKSAQIRGESFTDYPEAAVNNAKRALKWKEENGNPRGCGTPVGWARANQLANREPISFDTIKRMAAFQRFRRFAGKSYEEGCGTIMWDAWGGTEGVDYAIRKVKEIEG